MKGHPLPWMAIDSDIQYRLAHPRPEAERKIPAETTILFRAMVALVEVHTGLRPHRVTDSVDATLCAYYLTDREGQYAMLEVYPEDPDVEDPPTVLGWGTGSETIVCVSLADAAGGEEFRRMAAFVRGES